MKLAHQFRQRMVVIAVGMVMGHAAYGDDNISTVGQLIEGNMLARNGWFVVRTPLIVPTDRSPMFAADDRGSEANYAALLAMHTDSVTRVDVMNRRAYQHLMTAARFPERAQQELQAARDIYRALLAALPHDPSNATTLYRLARVCELLRDDDGEAVALTQLVDQDPQSEVAADAAFRAAQIRYVQTRYADAAPLYKAALKSDDLVLTLPAHYMLAWTDYKLGHTADALGLVMGMLDQALPSGDLADPDAALAHVPAAHAEMVADSLRLADLAFVAQGGNDPVGVYLEASGKHPRFEALLYASEARTLLDRQRYSDAAALDAAFVTRHPDHPSTPTFARMQIAALARGGFGAQEAEAKAQFAARFEPGAAYWKGKPPAPEVLVEVHQQLLDLAHYQHAQAQALPASAPDRAAAFARAASVYAQFLKDFPQDATRQTIQLALGDTLLEGGKIADAASYYHAAGYDGAVNPLASQAAFAEIQADHQLAAQADTQHSALLSAIDASQAFVLRFPDSPHKWDVLVRAAQDAHALGKEAQAVALATPLTRDDALDAGLRRQAWTVIADADFAQRDYAAAQQAYAALLPLSPPQGPERAAVIEQLGRSIYRQAEAARDAQDLRTAANRFEQVGVVAGGASIVAQADYDAAVSYQMLKDWGGVVRVLEPYRERHPSSSLLRDTDKLLADAYYSEGQYRSAIGPYARIAADTSEHADVRVEAAWLAARSHDLAGDTTGTAVAYTSYLSFADADLARAMTARERLADLARDSRDVAGEQRWLSAMLDMDAAAGARATDDMHAQAAHAALELGRIEAQRAAEIPLRLPLDISVPRRRAALETALKSFDTSTEFGFAETSTAATFETGRAYQSFADDIAKIPLPRGAGADDRAAWHDALGKEAAPFYSKARAAYETNLARARDGMWNNTLQASAEQLAVLDPLTYGKNDERAGNDAANQGPTNDSTVSQPFAAALDAMRSGRDEEASAGFEKLAQAYPNLSGAAANLGILEARAGHADAARHWLEQATAANRGDVIAWTWLGSLYRAEGRFADAQHAYQQAVASQPAYAAAHLDLALLADQDLHDAALATTEYQTYLKLNPERVIVYAWLRQMQGTVQPIKTAEAQ